MPQIKSHQTSVLQCYRKTWDQFLNLKSKFFHLPYTNVTKWRREKGDKGKFRKKSLFVASFYAVENQPFLWIYFGQYLVILKGPSEGVEWGVFVRSLGEDGMEQCPVVICIDLSPIFVQHCRRTFSTRHCIDQSPKSSLTWPDDLLDNKRNLYGCLLSERQSTTNPIKQYEKIVKW